MHDLQEQCQIRFLTTVFVVIFFKTMYNKTIIRFGFCDILNNQDLGKCYQPRPLVRLADDTYLHLDYFGYQKNFPSNCLLFSFSQGPI